jgi:membrane protease YdiL (CAAX protease family)
VAAISSSAVYAVVHFLTPALPVEIDARQPLAGLEYLGWVATTLVSTEVLPAVVGLFLVGLVLCATLHRTGSLALCVGLHAGWFAATKVAIRATTLGPAMLAAGSLPKRLLMIGSPWVWLATLLTGVAVWLAATRLRPRSAQAASGA